MLPGSTAAPLFTVEEYQAKTVWLLCWRWRKRQVGRCNLIELQLCCQKQTVLSGPWGDVQRTVITAQAGWHIWTSATFSMRLRPVQNCWKDSGSLFAKCSSQRSIQLFTSLISALWVAKKRLIWHHKSRKWLKGKDKNVCRFYSF